MHNYFTNYHNPPTCFDTVVSSSGSSQLVPCQATQVCQMQLLVIQFKSKIFHIGFMQVLAIIVEISVCEIFKILKLPYLQ